MSIVISSTIPSKFYKVSRNMLLVGILTPTYQPFRLSVSKTPPNSKPLTMTSSTAPSSIFFFAETVVEIVLFTSLIAFYTHVLLLLAVECDRYIYSGSDTDYTFNPNRRTKAGLILFLLSIIELLQAGLAFFYPALRVAGQMKLLGLAIFSLFAFIIATMIFGGILFFRQFKQADIEAEPDFELIEIVVPTEEDPTEEDSTQDDSLDLD